MSNPLKDLLNEMLTPEQKTKLKSHLKFEEAPKPEEPVAPVAEEKKMAEATLEDGTVIKYDTEVLAVGSMVSVVTPDGELPAPNGTHTLSDGTVIEVMDGKVVALTPVEVVAPVEPVAPVSDMAVQFSKIEKENETLKSELSNLKSEIEKQSKEVEAIKSFFKDLLEVPTEKPVEKVHKVDKTVEILKKFNP